jgi:hypothetical protein
MQISSIPPSSVAAIDAVSPLPVPQAAGPSAGKAGASAASTADATVASSSTASGSVTSSVTGSSSSASPAASQGALGGVAKTLDVVYATKVAGHSYLGGVQQAAGEYIASAVHPPDPPINAVGASIQAAENNLSYVIDEMA